MNPIAVLIVVLGLVLVVVGFKNKQDALLSAVMGKQYGNAQFAGKATS